MTEYKGVLVCGETTGNGLTDTTRELLKSSRDLADTIQESLSIVIVGEGLKSSAEEAVALGAERVYLAEGPAFFQSIPQFYSLVFADVCSLAHPSIILLGQTDMGRDVAPRLAASLGASICLDCIHLSIEQGTKNFLQTKPVYGGHALAVWSTEYRYQRVATMRPRAAKPAERETSRRGEVIPIKTVFNGSPIMVRLMDSVEEKVQGIKLEDAKVIVAGGGGIGGAEGFSVLEELAKTLNGTVGISRVPKDEGWMPGHLEIGQTGHVVRPDLYFAVGISGAPQHMAGCAGAKYIVAVNKDPEAHIFQEADFGIVGDYKEILPPLTEKLKELYPRR